MPNMTHHWRFFAALGFGILVFAFVFAGARFAGLPLSRSLALFAGGDAFFLLFLVLSERMIAGQDAADLRRRAKSEDEGILIVVLVTLAALGFFVTAVFTALQHRHAASALPLLLAGLGALLGWFVFHTVMAFHYAALHYYDDPRTAKDDISAFKFPHTARPDPWDFLYFSFVIGMTAQVSDVQVQTGRGRRAVLFHGIASFFFNTVFIAMAVNAGVAMAF